MPCCVAFGCSTRNIDKSINPPITFHQFPADEEAREKWIRAVRRAEWEPSKRSRICSKHFKEADFDRSPFCNKLKKDAVPSVFNAFSKPKLTQKKGSGKQRKRSVVNSRSQNKKRLKIRLESPPRTANDLETRPQEEPESDFATSSLNAIQKSVHTKEQNLVKLNNQVRSLQLKSRRFEEKRFALEKIISHIKAKSLLLPDEYSDMHSKPSAMYRRQLNTHVHPQFVKMCNDRQRKFPITLDFLSPQGL